MTKKLETRKLVASTEKKARKTKKQVWSYLAKTLLKPTRIKVVVNIDSINKLAGKNKGKILFVPGKLLARGELTQKVVVVAESASTKAIEKILAQKGEFILLKEFVTNSDKIKESDLVIIK